MATSTREISTRQIGSVSEKSPSSLPDYGPMELDSHADTCCAGSNCAVLEYTGKSCSVVGFNRDNPKDKLTHIPIIKTATAYDTPTGETLILVIPQALYLGDYLSYSLLCPNQLRDHGIILDDVPQHLAPDPRLATHSIYAPEENVRIPLEMRGVISLFYTRRPTAIEIEECPWIVLTSELEWDPHSPAFQENEYRSSAESEQTSFTTRNLLPAHVDNLHNNQEALDLIGVSSVFSDTSFLSIASTTTVKRAYSITKEHLSSLWGIGLHAAELTLQVTTQKGIRNPIHPIVRRYATKQSRLRYNQLGSKHGRFYSDTFFSDCKSTRGNTMAQLFTNDTKFLQIIPMKKKSEAANALMEIIQDIGVPSALHCDGARELQYGKWKEICQDYGIRQSVTEPYSPWQNRAELGIREAKKSIHRLMSSTKTPKPLWDYCAAYVAEITCLTVNDLFAVHGRTPYEIVTGNTPDITEYTEFAWYEAVIYYEDAIFPNPKEHIGRWLGVAHRVGQALCYWILNKSGKVLACTSIRKITSDELATNTMTEQIHAFDEQILRHFNNNTITLPLTDDAFDTVDQLNDVYLPFDKETEMPEDDDLPHTEAYDQYISARVVLPRGDTFEKAIVKCRKRDANGLPVGRFNSNPILDSRVYEVQFSDGASFEYSANVLAENIFATVDDEGYETLLLGEIIDH